MGRERLPADLFGIPDAEYQRRRTAFELCAWINATVEALKGHGQFDFQYLERRGENIKRLVEEAIPLSRLGLYLSIPGSEVFVTCFAHNEPFDGRVEVVGFGARDFRVEVTTTDVPPASTLRRHALARDGHVFLSGPIHRDRRVVLSEGAMVDVAEYEAEQIVVAMNALRRKAESDRYDESVAVLVYVTDCWLSTLVRFRSTLIRKAEDYLRTAEPKIGSVFFCYSSNYCVDAIALPPRLRF